MNYEPEPEDLDEDESPSDKELTHKIDDALARVRPERYEATDKEWMDAVVEEIKALLDDRQQDEVIRDAARRRVYRREAEATKRTNRILRDIAQTGQLPIGWGESDNWRVLLYDLLHLPLSIARSRVRFGVAGARDFEQWELESAREDDKRRAAQILARTGARLLARWVTDQNVDRADDLRPIGLPPDDGEAAP